MPRRCLMNQKRKSHISTAAKAFAGFGPVPLLEKFPHHVRG